MSDARHALASALSNGARLKEAGVTVYERLMDSAAPEFLGRLQVAQTDEMRHAVILRGLAGRFDTGKALPLAAGISRLATVVTCGPGWVLAVLYLTNDAFTVRLRALARRSRQLGYDFVEAPLLVMADDQATHADLIVDMLQDGPALCSHTVRDAAYWLQQVERADDSGLFPADGAPARAAAHLLTALGGDRAPSVRR